MSNGPPVARLASLPRYIDAGIDAHRIGLLTFASVFVLANLIGMIPLLVLSAVATDVQFDEDFDAR